MGHTKEELLEKNKDELVELARERELEGRSGMSKEELAEALADDSSSDVKADDEFDAEDEANDENNPDVVENLSPEGQEALEEMEPEQAEEAALALDASGPLHLESPSQRMMTGAVSEDHAKEQEELLKDKPEDFVGNVTEAGFDDEGNPIIKPTAEEHAALQERRESRLSTKENLGEGDDREIKEVKQEDVIDFPPPLAEREGLDEDPEPAKAAPVEGAPFTNTSVAGGLGRVYEQKSVFYTDGLSGSAEQNLERAYEIPELLQSNNPAIREAGDQSLSEARKDEKSDDEAAEADRVKSRDDDPSETSRNR